ncbi:hypothetical protein OPT61_g7494 [Boeremia exigua]|uniref:Uncharacterized protein n=1 Tax=Boeremia exigua TaxID=749465 RepID=A0ACC2I303_9PLEO|nr:hypothetical protein OPT61_g7494 [Boeremia exigua]
MPRWWVRDFLAEHASGWRVSAWAIVGTFVSGLLRHSYQNAEQVSNEAGGDGQMKHSISQERETSDGRLEETDNEHSKNHPHHTHTLSTSCNATYASVKTIGEAHSASQALPQAHHPFLHPRFSATKQNVFLSILDVVMIAGLTGHIVTYFVSLPTAIASCMLPAALLSPNEEFGEDKKQRSVQDRCFGLNMDIHIAGGFAVFVALVLGILHLAALVVRLWEWCRFGGQGVAQKDFADDGHMVRAEQASPVLSSPDRSFSSRSQTYSNSVLHTASVRSAVEPRNTSIGAEEASTGVGLADRNGGGMEQTARPHSARTDKSEDPGVDVKWDEVLLECLIDA